MLFYHYRKDVRLPVQLQRAMAAEAEAAREARAKVIAAEGEYKASTALKEASMVIAQSPAALQLRYLQVSAHLLPSCCIGAIKNVGLTSGYRLDDVITLGDTLLID